MVIMRDMVAEGWSLTVERVMVESRGYEASLEEETQHIVRRAVWWVEIKE